MGKLWKKKEGTIEKEIKDLDVKLKTLDPHTQSAEYEALLHIRSLLKEQAETGVLQKIDPNMVMRVVATLGIAGLIMLFESYGHIFTSKASSLMPKIL